LAQTQTTTEPQQKIINALIKNPELGQYKMPKETKLSYRTILRTLKPLETEGIIKQIRTEPSKKGGKEKKIYSLTLKGTLIYLKSITPKLDDYLVENNIIHYTLSKANEIITKKIQPLKLNTIENFLENFGKEQNLPIFKQITWLREHYGIEGFRAVVFAASLTLGRDRLPNLSVVKKALIEKRDKAEEVELDLVSFRRMEDLSLREIFEEEFGRQLTSLHGTGDLRNEDLGKIFAKVVARIESQNQGALLPLKRLTQTLKQAKNPIKTSDEEIVKMIREDRSR
jgi:DNA-binding PadR family transcriptional regulator